MKAAKIQSITINPAVSNGEPSILTNLFLLLGTIEKRISEKQKSLNKGRKSKDRIYLLFLLLLTAFYYCFSKHIISRWLTL